MSASNVSGKALSLRLAQGHNTCIMLIISISIQVMLVSTVDDRSTASKVNLKCTTDNQHFKWSASYYDDGCSDEEVMSVKRVQVYNKDCESPRGANSSILKDIMDVCNGTRECTLTNLTTNLCAIHSCIGVSYTCNRTDRRSPRNKSTTEKINEDMDGDNENKDIHTRDEVTKKPKSTTARSTTARSTTDTGATITDNKGTNENMNNCTDSTDMNVLIIVVVSVVAVVTTGIAVTLCLLVFCCQKSPLYRRSSIFRRDPQQQCQGEYENVHESTIQDLIPSPEDSAHHRGAFCVSPQHDTSSRVYQNTITSDYDHYDRISSNESPESAS